MGSAWKLDLASPPLDGKANEECIRFFAQLAGVPRAKVRIATGLASRVKAIEVEGIRQEDLERLLQAQSPDAAYPSQSRK